MISFLKEVVLKNLISVIITMVISLSVTILLNLKSPIKNWIINNISLSFLLSIIMLLLMLLILTLIVCYSFYKKLKDPYNPYNTDFEFDRRSGVSIRKKDKIFYCANCLSKQIYIPLRQTDSGWWCTNKDCPPYPNPDYKPPQIPKRKIISEGVKFDRW